MAYIGAGITRFNTADELTVTGDAQIDGNTLVVDSTNNNVGIGTTTIATNTKLHVDVGTNLNFEVENASSTLRLSALNDARSANIPMQFASSSFQFITGNVGIGTTTIGDKLVVEGAASATASIVVQDPTAADYGTHLSYDDANTQAIFGGLTNGTKNPALRVARDAASGIDIDASGRVGIGTTSPASLMHLESDTPIITLRDTSAYSAGTGPYIQFQGLDSGSTTRVFGQIYGLSNGSNSGELAFYTRNSGTTAERLRITSAGNVLVGKTSASVTTVGAELRPDGAIIGVRDADLVALLNRTSSDGEIISLRKDNSVVGSIGVLSSRLGIGTGDTGLFFNDQTDQVQPFSTSTNSARDAAIDLGTTDRRFKNLYLSGGAYIGGTGSANYLDDYEEGTWTPTYGGSSSNPSVTTDIQYGHYTKIGNIVIATFGIGTDAASGGSGSLLVNGLPFSSKSGADHLSGPALAYSFNQTISDMVMGISANDTKIILYSNNNSASTFATGALIDGANKNRLQGTVIYAVS